MGGLVTWKIATNCMNLTSSIHLLHVRVCVCVELFFDLIQYANGNITFIRKNLFLVNELKFETNTHQTDVDFKRKQKMANIDTCAQPINHTEFQN